MRGQRIVGIVLVVTLLLVTAAGLVQAQGPEQRYASDANEPVDSAASPAAAVGGYVPIQGRLTDANGLPLTGTYTFVFRLYRAASGGAAICSDTLDLAVSNGLFVGNMAHCNNADINGEPLFLGIQMGGDPSEMTPRQPIYPTPYAWSLRPGAYITGSIAFPNGILGVENGGGGRAIWATTKGHTAIEGWNGSDAADRPGIWGGSAKGYGVVGETGTTSGIGVVGLMTGYATTDQSLYWKPAGLFAGRNGAIGITKEGSGDGVIGWHKSTTGGGSGVVGASDSTSGRGVSGIAGANTGTTYGVYGDVDSPNGYGVYGHASASNANYGVYSYGNTGATGTKSAVVSTKDGYRSFYSLESPEVWFEDFGTAQLVKGEVAVAFESVFAQAVNLDEPYRVFLTPLGDCGLYVAEKTAAGFTVKVLSGQKCSSDIAFDYRIVAKRAGYEETRLAPAPDPDEVLRAMQAEQATQERGAP